MIHALADYSGLYQERQQELLDGPFAQERVEQKIDAWIELLRDEVVAAYEANPLLTDPALWEVTAESFKASLTVAREALAEDIAAHPE